MSSWWRTALTQMPRRVSVVCCRHLWAAGRGPPEVELHAAGSAKGRPPPPPVGRTSASFDDARASMGRQVLEDEGQSPPDRRSADNGIGDFPVQENGGVETAMDESGPRGQGVGTKGDVVLSPGVSCGTTPAFHALRSPAVVMPSRFSRLTLMLVSGP